MKSIKITGDFSIEEIQSTKRKPLKRKTKSFDIENDLSTLLEKGQIVKLFKYNKEENQAFVNIVGPDDVPSKYKHNGHKGAFPVNYYILTKNIISPLPEIEVLNGKVEYVYTVDKKELSYHASEPFDRNRYIIDEAPVKEGNKPTSYTPTGIERDNYKKIKHIRAPLSKFNKTMWSVAGDCFKDWNLYGFSKKQYNYKCRNEHKPGLKSADARIHNMANAIIHDLNFRFGRQYKLLTPSENNGKYQIVSNDSKRDTRLPYEKGSKLSVIIPKGAAKRKEEQLVIYA